MSHFVKQALLEHRARHRRRRTAVPADRARLGELARDARRQGDPHRRARHPGRPTSPSSRASSSTPGRSTASSARAASRPSSAGARMSGTAGRRAAGTSSAATRRSICCGPGAATRVRTWTPLAGPFHGFLITHNEAISIADYYTVREGGAVALSADRALRLSPVRRRGAVAARARRQELADAADASG